jgi:hypothetical protein
MLLPSPLPGVVALSIVETELEDMDATEGEVLHLADRSWMGDQLARRGLPHPPRCPLCNQAEEMMEHILTGCPFSKMMWHEVVSWIRSTSHPPVAGGNFAEGGW